MKKWRVKGDTFRVVDGAFAGRVFERGAEYDEIPPNEEHRFTEVKPATETVGKPARKTAGKGGDNE